MIETFAGWKQYYRLGDIWIKELNGKRFSRWKKEADFGFHEVLFVCTILQPVKLIYICLWRCVIIGAKRGVWKVTGIVENIFEIICYRQWKTIPASFTTPLLAPIMARLQRHPLWHFHISIIFDVFSNSSPVSK